MQSFQKDVYPWGTKERKASIKFKQIYMQNMILFIITIPSNKKDLNYCNSQKPLMVLKDKLNTEEIPFVGSIV